MPKIQIQHLLKLNVVDSTVKTDITDSNTTLVKVKSVAAAVIST